PHACLDPAWLGGSGGWSFAYALTARYIWNEVTVTGGIAPFTGSMTDRASTLYDLYLAPIRDHDTDHQHAPLLTLDGMALKRFQNGL
ncbi:MAG: hypothetical protein V4793_41495, partial [Paraburkholderia tropica]